MMESAAGLDRTPRPVAPPTREESYAAGRKLVATAEALAPKLFAFVDAAEEQNRIPDPAMEILTESGIFRALAPRRVGGLECDPASFFEAAARLGISSGSIGWVAGLVGVHAWQIAMLDARFQDEFWSGGPDLRASSSYAPTGKVKTVDGGFELSGRWAFSSGIDHSAWVILGGVIRDQGEPEFRSFLVPKSEWVVEPGSWDVVGLAGTGSKAITLERAFVPDYRTHRITDVYAGTDPGLAVNPGPLYRMSWLSIFYSSISSAAIGAATGALRAFVDETRTRVSPLSGAAAVANPFLHLRIANALSAVDLVERRLYDAWRAAFDAACEGRDWDRRRRTRHRFESADATAACYNAISEISEMAGGGSIFASKPVQRLLRDLLGMRNHPTAMREPFASVWIQNELGIPPPPFDKGQMASLLIHC